MSHREPELRLTLPDQRPRIKLTTDEGPLDLTAENLHQVFIDADAGIVELIYAAAAPLKTQPAPENVHAWKSTMQVRWPDSPR
jgi:hypothetical protein